MKKTDLEYARGFAVLTGDGGVPAALVQSAARVAPDCERPALFGPGVMEADGWWIDRAGDVWTPPARDRPFEPVRPSSADAVVASAPSGTAAPRAGGQSSTPSQAVTLGAQRAAAAKLTDPELIQRLKDLEIWEAWVRSPEEWRWRWDRRALYLGRALG